MSVSRIFREPNKEFAEPRLKNTALSNQFLKRLEITSTWLLHLKNLYLLSLVVHWCTTFEFRKKIFKWLKCFIIILFFSFFAFINWLINLLLLTEVLKRDRHSFHPRAHRVWETEKFDVNKNFKQKLLPH